MRKLAQLVTLIALTLTLVPPSDATAAENPGVSFTVETRADPMADSVAGVKIVVKTRRAADGTQVQWTDRTGQATFRFDREPYPVTFEAVIPGCDAENRTHRTLEEHPGAPVSFEVGGVVRAVVRQERENTPIPGVVFTLRSALGTVVSVTSRDGAAVFGCQPTGIKLKIDAALVGYEFRPVLVALDRQSTELTIRGRESASHEVLPAPLPPVASHPPVQRTR